MRSPLSRLTFGLLVLVGTGAVLFAEQPTPGPGKAALPDAPEFRTVDQAITTRISSAAPAAFGQPGYLGAHVNPTPGGKLVVEDLEPGSPAAKAGLQKGDVIVRVGDREAPGLDAFREQIQARAPGETLPLAVLRQDKPLDLTATLAAASRPMKLKTTRAVLGVQVGDPKEAEGVPITAVTADSPAARANLKVGEVILKVDGAAVTGPGKLRELLAEKNPGDTVTLTLFLADKAVELKIQLGEDAEGRGGRGWDDRVGGIWRKDVYRLAVVCVEYPDAKHNPKIDLADWDQALFSVDAYTKQSATGQAVHGSLTDYYLEQSFGGLRVEGKVFDWVEVGKKRMEYSEGTGTSNKAVLLGEALDKLYAREGEDALRSFDGVCYVYAGDRVNTSRGGLYWPHRASFSHRGKRWSYFIVPEGGGRMNDISVFCHEFGHMLGLPDLYARPEQPGSVGLGGWCAMSNQAGGGRPQHFSAWCKEQLGWVQPAVIDPTVKQKLVLAPVEGSPKECVKVLVKLDGSEYLLLENRKKQGFDASLPAEGLLIWRVVNNKPQLEESHGIDSPAGPGVFVNAIPYPSPANNAFTPFTIPSSRSKLGGGLPVHITNIRRLADGKVAFQVGYEFN